MRWAGASDYEAAGGHKGTHAELWFGVGTCKTRPYN